MDYPGVTKVGSSYQAQIVLNGKTRYLGIFPTSEEAAEAYQNAQEAALFLSGVPRDLPRGVLQLSSGRYRARVVKEGKVHNLGTFDTVEEASTRADEFRKNHGVKEYRRPTYEELPTHIRVASLPKIKREVDYYPDVGIFRWHNTMRQAMTIKEGFLILLYGKYHLGQYYDAYEVAWAAMNGYTAPPFIRVTYKNHLERDLRWENLEFYEQHPNPMPFV